MVSHVHSNHYFLFILMPGTYPEGLGMITQKIRIGLILNVEKLSFLAIRVWISLIKENSSWALTFDRR